MDTSNHHAKCDKECGIDVVQKLFSGKWKFLILWALHINKRRFGELQRLLPGITQSTLTKQLRELEEGGLITRYVYREVPPRVEYSLSEMGKSFIPLLKSLNKWGIEHRS